MIQVGHGQRLFKRGFRAHHWKCPHQVQNPSQQSCHHDKMLPPYDGRHEPKEHCGFVERRSEQVQGICESTWYGPHNYTIAFILPHNINFDGFSGLSRPAIFRSVEASLQRLQTDYIDVLQIHRFDEQVPPEETMEALHDLVKSGKVHYIGASSMWTYQFALLQHTAEKNRFTKFISMQNHYNLLYREEEREMNKVDVASASIIQN
jgi:hypothetical protein